MSSVIGNFIRVNSLDYNTFSDPVSKYRVSTPESLIDTDFEYGLQAVKWETIQQVANIPTFFSRTGDPPIPVSDIRSRSNMDIIYITLASSNTIFNVGTPFFIQGLQSSFQAAEGGYIVNRIIPPNIIVYRAKQPITYTGSIYDPNATTLYQGYFYGGTMYSLDQLVSITTDSNTPSTLTVNTKEAHGLNFGTQFGLVNSFGRKQYTFDTSISSLSFSNVYNPITNASNTFFILPNNDLQDNTLVTFSNLFGSPICNLPVPLNSTTYIANSNPGNFSNLIGNGSNFYVYNSYTNYFQLSTIPLNSNLVGNVNTLLSCTSNGLFPSCNVFYTIDNASDNSIYSICNIPAPLSTSFQMLATTQVVPNNITFAPKSVLNLACNCFTFTVPHRQASGAPIGYSNLGNQSIYYSNTAFRGISGAGIALSNFNFTTSNVTSNIYYAIRLDAYNLQLSSTPQYVPPYSNITFDYPASNGPGTWGNLNGAFNGSNILTFLSITGENYGLGTIAFSNLGSNYAVATNTINTLFKVNDIIRVEIPQSNVTYTNVLSVPYQSGGVSSQSSNYIQFSQSIPAANIFFQNGATIIFGSNVNNPGTNGACGLSNTQIYYLRSNTNAPSSYTAGSAAYSVYNRYADAIQGTAASNPIFICGGGYNGNNFSSNTVTIYNPGVTFEPQITFIGGSNKILILPPFSNIYPYASNANPNQTINVPNFNNYINSNLRYFVRTGLYPRADGFTVHRAYDGGIELIPPRCADGQVIRQTRRYFRYQPGKGIQVSLSVNFSAPLEIDKMYTSNQNSSQVIVITKTIHRLSSNLPIIVDFISPSTATVPAGTYPQNPLYPWTPTSNSVAYPGPYNTYTVNQVINNNTFAYNIAASPANFGFFSNTACNVLNPLASNYVTAPGIPIVYVNNWSNSKIRVGMFDDQNGMFYEYDGSNFYAVRRESTTQITGQSIVTFNSQLVTGQFNYNQNTINTTYKSQLSVGSNIVIRGQVYRVAGIQDDSNFYINPAYRGVSTSNVIISKIVDYKTPQSQWSIDHCDGTGPTGYILDIHKIQMIYFDYAWYGAGKIRYGFKETSGIVRYVHEFIHNNNAIRAFLRSGNLPARYEVLNYGQPTWVPSLMHWGTSVIMDGRYDDDKAYLFTAPANIIQYTNGDSITFIASAGSNYNNNILGVNTFTQNALSNQLYYGYGFQPPDINTPTSLYDAYTQSTQIGYSIFTTAQTASNAILVVSSNVSTVYGGSNISQLIQYNTTYKDIQNIRSGTVVIGCNIPTGTVTIGTPQRAATFSYITGTGSVLYTGQIFINKAPTAPFLSTPITLGITGSDLIPNIIPLVSVRLAPSVDSSVTGPLGVREIINKMQLKLRSIDILTTNDTECRVYLNATIDNPYWTPATTPSLAQLIKHNKGDNIQGGVLIFSYRVAGGTTDSTGKRSTTVTTQDLQLLGSIQNSIIGGNNVYPDGPDIITVAAVALDSAGVSATTPYIVSSRITWTEAQA